MRAARIAIARQLNWCTIACRASASSRACRKEVAMAEIVNLNQYRKRRQRRDAAKEAAENRVAHGRSKAERKKNRHQHEKAAKDLDDKRLD
jgi:hypothetical protein